jgi:ER lumen protein retaining receptor
MKLLYIGTSIYLVTLMTIHPHYKTTWYRSLDSFALTPLLALAGVLALIVPYRYTLFEVSWTFSIILESVAILPQLWHLTQVPSLPALPLSHLLALGVYRFFYVLHWIWQLASGGGHRGFDFTGFFFGVLQTIIWADFLWVWYNRKVIKLVDDQPSDLEAAGGAAEAASVDQGDLSRSFVLFHIFTMARTFQERFAAGRRGNAAGLSVSAYPDDTVRIQREGEANADYSDATPSVAAVAPTTAAADTDGFSVASDEEDEERGHTNKTSAETAASAPAASKPSTSV